MGNILLKGMAASGGLAEGVARVILPCCDFSLFKEGEILVTTLTDPTMVQVMIRAGAIVTDIGGITSHPAILSREMGIPCVVNTKEANLKIKSGMKLKINGSTGEIYELD